MKNSDADCQRCGAFVGFMLAPTRFIGEYVARVCTGCRNAWHELFMVEGEYSAARLRLTEIDAEAAELFALTTQDGKHRTSSHNALISEAKVIQDRMFKRTKSFVEEYKGE